MDRRAPSQTLLPVTVAVSDTGLDFTHAELAPKVTRVVDLTDLEDPPLCKSMFGVSDDDLAARYGGPAETDRYGHGSWIGGNIAAALGVDVVNISFGGYLDRSDPEQELIYQAYVDAVVYDRSKGTVIVGAAGNEHVRVGAGGQVLSHGPTVTPAETPVFNDIFGQYEVPGGIPGVVDVSSTGRLVVPSSATCPPGSEGTPDDNFSPVCKPITDRHQAAGQGKRDQLAYYSNYGPRIDLAGPGGARKFNLQGFDRGGTPGFPTPPAT